MVSQENYIKWCGPIAEYRWQTIRAEEKEIKMSFDLYTSKEGYLGWSSKGKSDINPLLDIKTDSATQVDIGCLLSTMVQTKLKTARVPDSLKMSLDNKDLVDMILKGIGNGDNTCPTFYGNFTLLLFPT